MSTKAKLRTPMKAVRGLGAAHSGTHYFWMQRLTALALIPLSVWFVTALVTHLLGASPQDMAQWLANPLVALAMAVLVFASFYHAKLGLQAVIEDYVHCEAKKIMLLLFMGACCYGLMAASLLAIIHLHLGGN
jgi:succinate dehydrogenase / fumarate reductase membrane anchor subunit